MLRATIVILAFLILPTSDLRAQVQGMEDAQTCDKKSDQEGIDANPKNNLEYFLQAGKPLASSLAIELVPQPVSNAADIERAIESFARVPNSGLVLAPDTTTSVHRDLIITLTAKRGLPAVYALRVFVAAGGLMSYGVDYVEQFQQAASYVDRILRGANPTDLPVQAPTKYETVVNLKTAKALGLTVPPGLLVAADEVIE
jgi:putative tryptophan/tyrosine transport system substrate-binding protein